MVAETEYDEELDTVGYYCPMPLSMTNERIADLEIGKVLKVIADDPAAEEDLKRWAKRRGQEIVDFVKDGNLIIYYFKKTK